MAGYRLRTIHADMLDENDKEKKKILMEMLKHVGVKECSPKDIMELVIRPFFKDYVLDPEDEKLEDTRQVAHFSLKSFFAVVDTN